MTSTEVAGTATGNGEYADLNGVHLYYERHGSGRPLILLHGGLMSGETFGPLLPALAAGREVITVDLQGHGRTADIDRPIDAHLMAGDIVALIGHLGLETPDIMGYSLGGGVAFWTAHDHPELVRRMIMVSANIKRSAIYAVMLSQQGQVSSASVPYMTETPMYQLYQRVAPRPDDFGTLLDKIGTSMADEFDFTDAVREIAVPTMFVAADADMFPPSHAVEVFALLDGGQRDGGWMREGRPAGGHALAIIPGATHYDICFSPVLAAAAIAFLDAES